MECPYCDHKDSQVALTRSEKREQIGYPVRQRRRVCDQCNKQFYTYEVHAHTYKQLRLILESAQTLEDASHMVRSKLKVKPSAKSVTIGTRPAHVRPPKTRQQVIVDEAVALVVDQAATRPVAPLSTPSTKAAPPHRRGTTSQAVAPQQQVAQPAPAVAAPAATNGAKIKPTTPQPVIPAPTNRFTKRTDPPPDSDDFRSQI